MRAISKHLFVASLLVALPLGGCSSSDARDMSSADDVRSELGADEGALDTQSTPVSGPLVFGDRVTPPPPPPPPRFDLTWDDGCVFSRAARTERVSFRKAYTDRTSRELFEVRVEGTSDGRTDDLRIRVYDRNGEELARGEVVDGRVSAELTDVGRRLGPEASRALARVADVVVLEDQIGGDCEHTAKKWGKPLKRFLRALCLAAATLCSVASGGVLAVPCSEAGGACVDAVNQHP